MNDAMRQIGRAVAEELRAEGAGRIYLGGAIPAGLGTPNSDIDVFVVDDARTGVDIRQYERDSHRVDVETFSLAGFESVIDAASPFRAEPDDMTTVAACSRSTLDRLVRFQLGEIVADDGTLQALADRLTTASPDIDAMIMARHCVDSLNLVEDVIGALAMDDRESAMLQATVMYTRAAEAALTRFGDRYIGAKWIWRRWARTMTPLGVPDLLPAAPAETSAEEVVARGLQLLVCALTGSWDVIGDRESGPGIPTGLIPIPVRGGVTLFPVEGRTGITISEPGLRLWAFAGRYTRDEAVDAFLAAAGAGAPAREDVDAYFDALVRARAI